MGQERGQVNGGGWRSLAMGLVSIVLLMVGAFFGDFVASLRYRNIVTTLEVHERLPGHPVMVERVDDMKEQLDKIEAQAKKNGELLMALGSNH